MSIHSRSTRIALSVAPAAAIFATFTYAIHWKRALPPTATKIVSTDSSAPAAGSAVADKRHEALALESQLQKKPNHVPILTRLAQLARENGKPGKAIPYLRKIIELEPKNTEAHLELGRDLYDTGDITGALEQTNQILTRDPKNVDALYNLGAIYANSNKIPAARGYWARAVASDPTSDSGMRATEGLARLIERK